MGLHPLRRFRLSRSVLWFRLWLLFKGPKPPLCSLCRIYGKYGRWGSHEHHEPCFEVGCHCRCSRVEGFRP
jgi:hypothetical protein